MIVTGAETLPPRHDWAVVVRSERGAKRDAMEDATTTLYDVPFRGRNYHILGVFDGVGGQAHGAAAAQAASANVLEAFRLSERPRDLLWHLNAFVEATGGGATAVVAILPSQGGAAGHLLTVGDGGAFLLDASGRPRRLNKKDVLPGNRLFDFLGHAKFRGHWSRLTIPKDSTLLLCTDGVDGVVPEATLAEVLLADPRRLGQALDDLFGSLDAKGSPDNATALVARRLSGSGTREATDPRR